MSNDAVAQLMQGRNNYYTDWHPAAMALLWRWLDMIYPGPLVMLLVQLSLLWLGCVLLLGSGTIIPSWLACALVLPCLLFPPVFGIMGAILKDNMMAGALLMGFGMMQVLAAKHADPDRQSLTRRRVLFLLFPILMLCLWALLLRINSIAAVFSLIWFAGFLLSPWPRILLRRFFLTFAIAIPTTLLLFAGSGAINSSIVDMKTQSWRSVAMFDIAGVAVERGELHFDGKITASELGSLVNPDALTIEALNRHYTPHAWGRLTGPIFSWGGGTTDELAALSKLWQRTVIENPTHYLAHRWAVFREMIWLTSRKPDTPVYMLLLPEKAAKRVKFHYRMSDIQLRVRGILLYLENDTILFRPYIYLLLGLITICCGLFLIKKDHGLVFFLSFSGLGYELLLFIATPSTDFRYSHWMILSVWASLLLLVGYAVTWSIDNFRSSDVASPPLRAG